MREKHKYYEVQMINACGDGYSTPVAIVIDPKIEEGVIKAIQVGEWDLNKKSLYEKGKYFYRRIPRRKFMLCGNATCVERTSPFSKWDDVHY